MNKKIQELSELLYNNKNDNIDKSKITVLKNEYKSYQVELINEGTKQAINAIMPLELSLFVNKYLKFTSLNNFKSLDNLYEKILENEYV